MSPSSTVCRSPRRNASTRSASRSMARLCLGTGGGRPASMFIFTAGCTGLILHWGPGGCKPFAATGMAAGGFQRRSRVFLEKLIMNWVFLIPITAIVMSLGLAMLHLWADHQRKSQMLAQMHRERMAAIEKGVEVPPMNADPFMNKAPGNVANPARILRNGVFMLSF